MDVGYRDHGDLHDVSIWDAQQVPPFLFVMEVVVSTSSMPK